MTGPDPRAGFEASLEELERCADDSLAKMSDALGEVLRRWPQDTQVFGSLPTGRANTMVLATLGPMGALQQNQQRAVAAGEETRRRLLELARVYRQADERAADGFAGG